MTQKPKAKRVGWEDNAARYTSDVFAMIGTVFLWMYWPSFNGAMADNDARERVAIHTVLSLTLSLIHI